MALTLVLNGAPRVFEDEESPAGLLAVLAGLGLKTDRIALELNGELAPRAGWAGQTVKSGDKLEIVHFVGGGRGEG